MDKLLSLAPWFLFLVTVVYTYFIWKQYINDHRPYVVIEPYVSSKKVCYIRVRNEGVTTAKKVNIDMFKDMIIPNGVNDGRSISKLGVFDCFNFQIGPNECINYCIGSSMNLSKNLDLYNTSFKVSYKDNRDKFYSEYFDIDFKKYIHSVTYIDENDSMVHVESNLKNIFKSIQEINNTFVKYGLKDGVFKSKL